MRALGTALLTLTLAAVAAAPADAAPFRSELYKEATLGAGYPSELLWRDVENELVFNRTRPWPIDWIRTGGAFTARFTTLVVVQPGNTLTLGLRIETRARVTVRRNADAPIVHAGGVTTQDLTFAPGSHFLEIRVVHETGPAPDLSIQLTPPTTSTGLSFDPNPAAIQNGVTYDFNPIVALTEAHFIQTHTAFAPAIENSIAPTTSPSHLLRNRSTATPGSGESSANVPLTIAFDRLQRLVSLRNGADLGVGELLHGAPSYLSSTKPTLRAYNANGELVATDRANSLTAHVEGLLSVAVPVATIARVELSWGGAARDERIDRLHFEGSSTAAPPLGHAELRFATPMDGAVITAADGDAPVILEVRSPTRTRAPQLLLDGVLTAVSEVSRPSCTGTCRSFSLTRHFAFGRHEAVGTVLDGTGAEIRARVAFTRPAPQQAIRVVDELGAPVEKAQVFIDGAPVPILTDASGNVVVPRPSLGAKLAARKEVQKNAGLRAAHKADGSSTDWSYKVYITSVPILVNGTTPLYVVNSETTPITLTLRKENALIAFNVLISTQWNATQPELDGLVQQARVFSDYLYNATDGQFILEFVRIVDNDFLGPEADINLQANRNFRCWTNQANGIHHGAWSRVYCERLGTGQTLAHEWGHFALGLLDEYTGDPKCHLGQPPPYDGGGGKAVCMMNDQFMLTKICSGHAANPHQTGGVQAVPCWDTVYNNYSDGLSPHWTIRNPTNRGEIVDRLPAGGAPVAAWNPTIISENQGAPSCTYMHTRSFSGSSPVEIWTERPGGASMRQGTLTSGIPFELVGVLPGDIIHAQYAILPASDAPPGDRPLSTDALPDMIVGPCTPIP